jgi:hypothetical protein
MLKNFLLGIFLSLGSLSVVTLVSTASAEDSNHKLIVFKSPTCGCCSNWISHMESNGFEVEAINKSNMANVKNQYGIDGYLQSCHTAIDVTAGYVFEGHIPAGAIKQFLSRAPNGAKGLAVPGMPAGSPGMEMGNRFDPYQIVQINKDRPASLFMNVETQSEQFTIGTHHE